MSSRAEDLKNWMRNNHSFLTDHICPQRLTRIMSAKDTKEFDSHAVVPAHGYRDADHYWTDSSAVHNAKGITIPTLAISADDDPICSSKGCPITPDKIGEGLVVARTKSGGHLAFAEGFWPPCVSWMDRATLDWLDCCLHVREESGQNGGEDVQVSLSAADCR